MENRKTACFYCKTEDRYPACHDTCQKPEYLADLARRKKIKTNKSKDNDAKWAQNDGLSRSHKIRTGKGHF